MASINVQRLKQECFNQNSNWAVANEVIVKKKRIKERWKQNLKLKFKFQSKFWLSYCQVQRTARDWQRGQLRRLQNQPLLRRISKIQNIQNIWNVWDILMLFNAIRYQLPAKPTTAAAYFQDWEYLEYSDNLLCDWI